VSWHRSGCAGLVEVDGLKRGPVADGSAREVDQRAACEFVADLEFRRAVRASLRGAIAFPARRVDAQSRAA